MTGRQHSGWLAVAAAASLAACADRPVAPAVQQVRVVEPAPVAPPLPASGDSQPVSIRIGLLLPLTGPYAAPAERIRDGFVGALLESAADAEVRVYDTKATAEGASIAWDTALADGARTIVGPVTRENVRRLGERAGPDVTLIALNHIGDVPWPAFHQLAVTAEDEARQAARSASADGRDSAVLLVPDTDWGERVAAAFAEEFASLGGTLRAQALYDEAARDFSSVIQPLFAIDESLERHRALEDVLGRSVVHEPRIRADVDVVFLGATADTSRMLVPQLRFHGVRDMPVYATARVNDGSASRHRVGLRFCEAPIVLDSSGPHAGLRGRLEGWLGERDLEALRLMALGHDAYRFAEQIVRAGAVTTMSGATGILVHGDGGVVNRWLRCVEIGSRGIVPLPPPGLP